MAEGTYRINFVFDNTKIDAWMNTKSDSCRNAAKKAKKIIWNFQKTTISIINVKKIDRYT